LFLCIFQEHYKLINEALSAIQGAVLILEQKIKRLIQLRKDLGELNYIQESATADIAGIDEDGIPSDKVLGIKPIGEGLEARASLSRFSVCYRDIIEKSRELGMDARDFYDELDDECDEKSLMWQEMSLQLR
jgi:hypothetical protein